MCPEMKVGHWLQYGTQSVSDKVTVPVLSIGFGQDHIIEFENISEKCDGLHEHEVLYPPSNVYTRRMGRTEKQTMS